MPQAELPFVLWEQQQQTQFLYAVCPRAAASGLKRGMRLAEARAIVPDIQMAEADKQADAEALKGLARWLSRYSPLTAVDGENGLLIDSTGCDHLFGGERAMGQDIQTRLSNAGYEVRLAIAETRAAAWALARYNPGVIIAGIEELHSSLAPLPVQALRIPWQMVQTLRQLGLQKVGNLLAIPRPALARRFKAQPAKDVTALLTRLDQVLGRKSEPISPLAPLPVWQAKQAFGEPAQTRECIEHTLQALLSDLCRALTQAEQGVRSMCLRAFRTDGSVQELTIGTNKPSRTPQHLMHLFREKLNVLEADFGFDLLILAVMQAETLEPQQYGKTLGREDQSVAYLLDRLAARLGNDAVVQVKHTASHLPERVQSYASVAEGVPRVEWSAMPAEQALRPLRLLRRPEVIEVLAEVPEGPPRKFRWRRVKYLVVAAEGPERIAAEWWITSEGQTRDYYRVEVETGERFWVFRCGLYPVSGVRSGETVNPIWYMHGFFV